MFGIGFTEILLISVIAILFLGPDKLPETMIQIAKFIKSIKKTIGDAKSSLDEEMRIDELKKEALNYKQQLDNATNELEGFKNIDINEILDEGEKNAKRRETPSIENKIKPKEEIIAETKSKIIEGNA